MNKIYYLIALFIGLTFISCSSDGDDVYVDIPVVKTPIPEIPVSVNLTQVPYSKLSDYHFFKNELKNQLLSSPHPIKKFFLLPYNANRQPSLNVRNCTLQN